MGTTRIVKTLALFYLLVTILLPARLPFQVEDQTGNVVQAATPTPTILSPTKLDAGLSAILYRMKKGDITPGSEVDLVIKQVEKLGGIDVHIRAQAEFTPSQLMDIESAGAKLVLS